MGLELLPLTEPPMLLLGSGEDLADYPDYKSHNFGQPILFWEDIIVHKLTACHSARRAGELEARHFKFRQCQVEEARRLQ